MLTREQWRRIGIGLAICWVVLLVMGAAGEIFEIESLRRATDLKRIFLR